MPLTLYCDFVDDLVWDKIYRRCLQLFEDPHEKKFESTQSAVLDWDVQGTDWQHFLPKDFLVSAKIFHLSS